MKYASAFFILIFFSFRPAIAQPGICLLHPALGDTIDLTEKKKFLLFQEVDSRTFQYAFLTCPMGKRFVTLVTTDSVRATVEMSDSVAEQYYNQVEKLSEYYRMRSRRDSTGASDRFHSGGQAGFETMPEVKPIMTPALREQLSKNARINQRVKDDEERSKLRQKGLDRDLIIIE